MALSKTVTDNELYGICLGFHTTVKRNSYESRDLEMFWAGCGVMHQVSDQAMTLNQPSQ